MDLDAFCRQSKLVVVVGKGGVGKTTVTATLALAAAGAGLDVLVLTLDDGREIAALFDCDGPLTDEARVLRAGSPNEPETAARISGRIRGRIVASDTALATYLREHGMTRISRRLIQSGAIDVVATAVPGLRDVLVLNVIRECEARDDADLIILDAPATGHALTFLTSSRGLADAARAGPLHAEAERVVEMLRDPVRCQVLLVTIPEETPVNEVTETAFRIEDDVDIALGPVVVNSCYRAYEHLDKPAQTAARSAGVDLPPADAAGRLDAAAAFRSARQQLQAVQLQRLSASLPLPQLRLPFVFSAGLGPGELEELAEALRAEVHERL